MQTDAQQINSEADALFWARVAMMGGTPQPGRRLDPRNADDRVLIPIWRQAHADVAAAWAGLAPYPNVVEDRPIPAAPVVHQGHAGGATISGMHGHHGGHHHRGGGRRWFGGGRDATLLEVAPILAPAASGAAIDLSLRGNVLTASIVVDGHSYQGSADVGGLLDAVTRGIADYHARLHAGDGAHDPVAAVGVCGADVAVFQRGGDRRPPRVHGARERAWDALAMAEGSGPIAGVVLRREDPAGTVVFFDSPQDASAWYAQTHGELASDGTWSNADTYEYLVIYSPDPEQGYRAVRESFGKQPAGGAVAHVQAASQRAIRSAGEALVGGLLAQHDEAISAGWWHSLTSSVTHALHDAEHAVEGAVGGLGSTLKMFKGPIAKAAAAAAAAGAMAIPGVGPVIAPMAGKLANDLVNAAAGDGSAKHAAMAAINAAKAQAKTNPDVAKALAVAHKAVTKATGAYHVAQTVAHAAAGNPAAKAQVVELAAAAKGGDGAAAQALDLANEITSMVANASPSPNLAPTDPAQDAALAVASGWFVPIAAVATGYGAGALSWPWAHGKLAAQWPNVFGPRKVA